MCVAAGDREGLQSLALQYLLPRVQCCNGTGSSQRVSSELCTCGAVGDREGLQYIPPIVGYNAVIVLVVGSQQCVVHV